MVSQYWYSLESEQIRIMADCLFLKQPWAKDDEWKERWLQKQTMLSGQLESPLSFPAPEPRYWLCIKLRPEPLETPLCHLCDGHRNWNPNLINDLCMVMKEALPHAGSNLQEDASCIEELLRYEEPVTTQHMEMAPLKCLACAIANIAGQERLRYCLEVGAFNGTHSTENVFVALKFKNLRILAMGWQRMVNAGSEQEAEAQARDAGPLNAPIQPSQQHRGPPVSQAKTDHVQHPQQQSPIGPPRANASQHQSHQHGRLPLQRARTDYIPYTPQPSQMGPPRGTTSQDQSHQHGGSPVRRQNNRPRPPQGTRGVDGRPQTASNRTRDAEMKQRSAPASLQRQAPANQRPGQDGYATQPREPPPVVQQISYRPQVISQHVYTQALSAETGCISPVSDGDCDVGMLSPPLPPAQHSGQSIQHHAGYQG